MSKVIPLSKTTKFIVDNRGRTAPTAKTGIPLIATNCIDNNHLYPQYLNLRYVTQETYDNWFRAHPKPGDIILTLKGSQNGAVCLVPDPVNFAIAQDMVALRADEDVIDPLYLFAALRSPDVQSEIKNLDVSGVIPHLKKTDFDKLLLPLPERNTQKIIGEVYYYFSKKIELLHRQNKTLEAMAEALFWQWFRPPSVPPKGGRIGRPGLEKGEEESKKSSLGDLGAEGWREGKIPDEFAFTMGQSPVGTSFNEDRIGTPMFQGNADFGFRFPSERVYTTEPTRFAEPLDTLVSVRAPVGEQNMALVKCCIGRGVAAFRYSAKKDYYTYTYFKIRSLMTEIKQFNDGGTVFGSIGKSDFEALDITIPPQSLIEDFEQTAKPINDKVIENCTQIRTLEKLRDTLLPKLMSGEVRVKI